MDAIALNSADDISEPKRSLLIQADDPEQLNLPCLYMRGGSSKGGFFLETDLPSDPIERDAVLLAAYGSPDVRQIDGIGAADPLTSKAAIVARSNRADADVEYTFCQVDLTRAKVSTGGNCGNMLAAVGPFAVWRGLIQAHEGENRVRIFTTNTGQVVEASFAVKGGVPCVEGSTLVPGVPGSGATVAIDFGDCAGSVSGRLLPTGHAVDMINIDDREVPVSLVDAATPFVYVVAEDIDGDATAAPDAMQNDRRLMDRLEQVRGWAATVLGFVDSPHEARDVSPNVPRVIMVSSPKDYVAGDTLIQAQEINLCVRQLTMQKPHKALAVTGAVCTSVACRIPGTVVNLQMRGSTEQDIRLGHPSGVLSVDSRVDETPSGLKVRKAAVNRTARLIMAGKLFVPQQKVRALQEAMK
ncbi:methylitaconate delta2-delta3-isomerase [Parapusillimonas sp. SGNA-6]|nr:methylitaconate delta2-delta3-isomerase [Parapusillimonas sp. SGNA-6]